MGNTRLKYDEENGTYTLTTENGAKVVVTSEDIVDIIESAFNGGITHWCPYARVLDADGMENILGEYATEQLVNGGYYALYAEDDGKYHKLTISRLLNGIAMAVDGGYYSEYGWVVDDGCYDDYEWLDTKYALDCGQIDAEVADVIVQLAVFGEIIYG